MAYQTNLLNWIVELEIVEIWKYKYKQHISFEFQNV